MKKCNQIAIIDKTIAKRYSDMISVTVSAYVLQTFVVCLLFEYQISNNFVISSTIIKLLFCSSVVHLDFIGILILHINAP